MKKVFVLGYALLFSASLLLAETTATIVPPTLSTTPVVGKPTQWALPNATSSTVDGITRNIDRRLTYFNRYMQSRELDNIKKLISQDDPDFYMNFMKYVESSAVFSLSRDPTQKIIKTPLDEYMFSAFMSLGDLKTKVSITFVEEKSTQGSKWLIKDSNLHILVPLVGPVWGSLASSALGTPTPVNPSTTPLPTPNTPVTQATTPPQMPTASPVGSSAVTPGTQTPVTPKTSIISIASTGISSLLIWEIVGGSILVGFILFFIIRKSTRKMTPILTPITTGSPAVVPLNTTIPPIPPISAAPISNVSVSTIAETVSPPLSIPAPLPSPEKSPIDEAPVVPLVAEIEDVPSSFAPAQQADNSMPPVASSTLLLWKTPSELKNSPHPIFASALEEKAPQI